jgi:single-strand DNA-binding protein
VAEQYLRKGSKVYIEGQLQTRKYEQGGVEKYTTEVVLQRYRGELTMLDGKGEGGSRSYDDDGGGFTSKAGGKRTSDGPRETFSQDLDDEIPF